MFDMCCGTSTGAQPNDEQRLERRKTEEEFMQKLEDKDSEKKAQSNQRMQKRASIENMMDAVADREVEKNVSGYAKLQNQASIDMIKEMAETK